MLSIIIYILIVKAPSATEAENIISTTAKSLEEKIEKSVEKIAVETGMPTWALVALLIGNY